MLPIKPSVSSLQPFSTDGSWLRCQLHAHTTNSDGDVSPQALADHYARAGYDVLAITDHHHRTQHDHERLLVIPSSELTADLGGGAEADVLALGAAADPPRTEFDGIEAAAAWTVEHGGVAFLAHPHWSVLTPDRFLTAPSLTGIEVYNGRSQLSNGNGLSEEVWDRVLLERPDCLGLASDDCHCPGHDSRLAWTMVRAPRSAAGIVDALRQGMFYGTSGAQLHDVQATADGVHVRCSPARAITLHSSTWEGGRVNSGRLGMCWRGRIDERTPDGLIVAATLRFPERTPWGRIAVEAPDGARAWTNAWELPLDSEPGESSWG